MNRPNHALRPSRSLARFPGVALVVFLLLLGVAAGCGGKDKDEDDGQAEVDRPHSMVPGNLDSLIASTGSNLVSDEVVEEAQEQLDIIQVKEINAEEAPPVAAQAAAPKVSAVNSGSFSLQVGSFRQANNATSLVGKVKDLGYPAVIEMADVGGLMYHRVFVRGLADRDQAEKLGEELRSGLGINYLVLRQQ